MKTLDDADYQLVKLCKTDHVNRYEKVLRYWCETRGMNPEYFSLGYIMEILLDILEVSGALTARNIFTLSYDLRPDNDFRFSEKPDESEPFSRWYIRLAAMVERLPVVDIPGYKEWLNKN